MQEPNPLSSPKPGQAASPSSAAETTLTGLRQTLIVATGPDHPGILDDISAYVAERRGRIQAIRVANLRGRFALLLLVAADGEGLRRLGGDLQALCDRTGVRATLESPDDPSAARPADTRFRLVARGAGEHEVLRQTSNLLRVLNINIEDIESTSADTDRLEPDPAAHFDMTLILGVPRDIPVGKVRELLGQLFAGLSIEWDLTAL